MRFRADGPAIPDELLLAGDQGRIIFFCGAGVSRARAGLSDFFGLATSVVDALGVPDDSAARRILVEAREIGSRTGITGLISVDRIFGLLERDFLTRDIEAEVARALRPPSEVDLSAHRTMLDLARSPDGRIRLVTTNFDLLFEACDNSIHASKPPRLPDPLRHGEFEGIIHLHGKVNDSYDGADGDGFVLSSSEFGRAYLSDGWATQFIKSILRKYLVVFVGYTADDPPVQYLLEALRQDPGALEGVFAFQSGEASEAEAKWQHKGVQAIGYDDADDHRSLWETLDAWAGRVRNVEGWFSATTAMAKRGPEVLAPHERGQVAHVVSTLEGIRSFSAPDDPPPAEWLCVFDPAVRYSPPMHLRGGSEVDTYFDPFNAYGLDSDLVPPSTDPDASYPRREIPDGAWDCFAATRLDRQSLRESNYAAVRGHLALNVPDLPARLNHLGLWISKVSNQPTAVWWAAGQRSLHPNIQRQIRFRLGQANRHYTPLVRQAWRYIFDAWKNQESEFGSDWYDLKELVTVGGWTNAAVHDMAFIKRPRFVVKRPILRRPMTLEREESPQLEEMLRVDVEYPPVDHNLQVPDNWLALAVREFRKNLELAVSLERDLGGHGLYILCSAEPTSDSQDGSSSHRDGLSQTFLLYVELFKRLVECDRQGAKQEFLSWPLDETTVFTRLRIWACGMRDLISSPKQAATLAA